MTARSSPPPVLSESDRMYLLANLSVEPGPFPDDPQAQPVYAAEQNETAMHSPAWTRSQIEAWVAENAVSHGLRVKVVFRKRRDACAYAGSGGGTIFLPEDHVWGTYRSLEEGEYLANIVVHEFAHVVAVNEHWGETIQSHGPEFVRCYMDILSTVMPVQRTEQAMAFLGVGISPA